MVVRALASVVSNEVALRSGPEVGLGTGSGSGMLVVAMGAPMRAKLRSVQQLDAIQYRSDAAIPANDEDDSC